MAKQGQSAEGKSHAPYGLGRIEANVLAAAERTARDFAEVADVVGGSRAMFETIQAATEASRSLANSPTVRTMRDIQDSQLASRRASDALMEVHLRKARSEQAAIDGAEGTVQLVDLAAKQEEAIESMASLLGQLVQTQVGMYDDQRRAARTSRRWRWVTFAVALIAAGASVVNVVRAFIG
jgi:hypothetical protein